MTRVLVAGAAGFIGRHVVDYVLDETDWEVVALTRGQLPAAPPRDRVSWFSLELPRTARVGPFHWEAFGPIDYVINLVADADPWRSITHPVDVFENNVGSCQTLLEWARTQPNLQRFIQVSSAEVFGVNDYAFRENAAPYPLSPYAASKAAQDVLALAYREAYKVPVIVSPTANVFGEGQPSNRFLPTVVRRVLAGESVTVASGWRRFIHARDCAAAWVWMLQHAPEQWSRCNVAGERECDHAGFVQAILTAMRGRLPDSVTLRAAGEGELRAAQCGDVVLDGSRLADAGWRHPLGLDAGIERAVAAELKELS